MERDEILHWFEEHPEVVHGDAREILTRCELSVRRQAREDAWMAAKHYVERRRHAEEAPVGSHASEAYVAHEVCHQLAHELGCHEPHPGAGDEDHLAGGPVKAAIDGKGWEVVASWILEVAREEEHKTWLEITRYTDRHARELIEKHHLSDDCSFDRSSCFGEVAVRISQILEDDFAHHAFPH